MPVSPQAIWMTPSKASNLTALVVSSASSLPEELIVEWRFLRQRASLQLDSKMREILIPQESVQILRRCFSAP
jgi:hypothetical protein